MKQEISRLLDTRGSLDMDGDSEEYCTVRHFSISGRKVVNRGDSFKVKRSTSGHSVTSMESSGGEVDSPPRRSPAPQAAPQGAYSVAVIGASSVGKASLISQFMTSEYRYLHGHDHITCGGANNDSTVTVLLDGEESELTFTSMRDNVIEDRDNWRWMQGLVVVYSVTDRASFTRAQRVLETLVTENATDGRAVILVANKVDLARSRLVSEQEGRILATACNCKYSEVSVMINHNVDELLVGLLAQIRLRMGVEAPNRGKRRKYRGSKTSASFRGLLSKLRIAKSHSCHKLHEL